MAGGARGDRETARAVTSYCIHPRATAEIDRAAAWYAERSKTAARRFLDAVEEGLDRMVQLPDAFPLVPLPNHELTLRRVSLRRFPYVLVYAKTSLRLEVIAIAHMKQRPLYWIVRIADIEDDLDR